jgi:YD repeat-containing protein
MVRWTQSYQRGLSILPAPRRALVQYITSVIPGSAVAAARLLAFLAAFGGSVLHAAAQPQWSNWAGLGGGITKLATAFNPDGRIEVFAIGTDRALNHIWQTTPGGGWSNWAGLGGGATELATASNRDGRIEIFAIGTDGALNHIWQTTPGGAWSNWAGLGGGITQLATALNPDGRIEVFAIGTDGALNHIWQTTPGGAWSNWAGLGGGITELATARNRDGRIEVFAIGTDGALNHIWQMTPGGAWSNWAGLGGGLAKLATALNADGRIEVFAIRTDGALNHIWQMTPGGAWSNWAGLGGGITELATALNADGRIEVFAIGMVGALNHIWQTTPGGGWSNWAGLGGGMTELATAPNRDGRIEVFAIGTDRALYHAWQTSPGAPVASVRAAGIREPPETGPGWRDGEYQNAMSMENRRGRDVRRRASQRRTPRNANVDAGTGNGNYLLAIPLLDLPGRGLGISLSLYYNSLLWQSTTSGTFVFDHDWDWPAPGWSLGYGKIYPAGSSGFIIQDADATRHLCVGSWTLDLQWWDIIIIFNGKTNDGTLLDCSITLSGNPESPFKSGRVSYPDGAVVDYETGDAHGGALYPNRITDRNGNYVSIAYELFGARSGLGPNIASITDTLGRVVDFNYDSILNLTSISAPGIDGRPRTIVRLHYSQLQLYYDFIGSGSGSGGIVRPGEGEFQGIDAIYFPGDGSGYWFGDPDSYSTYGMIAKVSRRRAMSFTPGAQANDQGSISAGVMTDERVYNYPNATVHGPALSDAPNYTTMTESWAGMTTPPAVTTYLLEKFPVWQRLVTTYPDGTRSYVDTNSDPTKFDNGLVFDQLIDDGTSRALVLSQTYTTYELGYYNSPRVKSVNKTNQLGQTTTTVYNYIGLSNQKQEHNEVFDVQELGYTGALLRKTSIGYVQYPAYDARHIFNLPNDIVVFDGSLSPLAETLYTYDDQPMAQAADVTNLSPAFDPTNSSYDPTTINRGNITQVVKATDESGDRPRFGLPEERRYDITGNLVSSSRGTHQTTYSYTRNSDYGYVESVTQGSPPWVLCPFGPCLRISRSFTYDYGTGQVTSSTNENGRTTTFAYDPASLRLTGTTFSTGAFESIAYDDLDLKATDTSYIPQVFPAVPTIATQPVTTLNGLGLPVSVASLADGGGMNVVAMQYDARGRLAQKSLPYRMNSQQPEWTSFTYDALGRETIRQTADGSQYLTFYDEASQPSSASGLPGETVRSTDPWGRERWYRLDALGSLAEVVEPAANGNGSVSAPGNMATRYSFDALGNLTQVSQGEQIRQFQFDPLGRLTAEYLPEKSRSLDASGRHVASGALWSDVFTYDDYSNLTSHTDARGVNTTYAYNNDPLDRLQEITYDLSGAWDSNNPVAPSPNVFFNYMKTGDMRRPMAAYSSAGSNPSLCEQDYGYDAEGRLASRSSTCRAGQPLAIDYGYDPLNRITTAPIQSSTGQQASPGES